MCATKSNLDDLNRFILAQDHFGTFDSALNELKAGHKTGHWMWYIFPQVELGMTETSKFYSIRSLDESRRYLADEVLGPRLDQAVEAAMANADKSAVEIFDNDAVKFHACLDLFNRASQESINIFQKALNQFFDGEPHIGTLDWLAKHE